MMPKTRKEIRRGVRDNYLAGRARKSYRHRPTLNSSFQEQPSPSETASACAASSTGCCAQCRPILSRYSEIFNGLTHRGSELKKRKHLNPDPKRPDITHYHDLNRTTFGISRQRLACQRAVKKKQSEEPLREMTKVEVKEKRISEYVVCRPLLILPLKNGGVLWSPLTQSWCDTHISVMETLAENQTQAKAR